MGRRRAGAIAAIAATAALLGIVAVVRSRPAEPMQPRTREALAEDLIERGQRAFGRLSSVRFDDLARESANDRGRMVGRIAEIVAMAEVGGAAPDARRCAALAEEAARFIVTNFISHDAEAYLAWAASRGRVPVPREELVRFWNVGLMHGWAFDEPLPELMPVADPGWTQERAIFQKFWDHAWSDASRRPIGMADEPAGIFVSYGTFDIAEPTNRPFSGGMLGRDLWIGAIAMSTTPFLHPRGTVDGRVPDRFDGTAFADVACLFAYKDGSRRPIILTFLWDPEGGFWVLHRINLHNFRLEKHGFIAS